MPNTRDPSYIYLYLGEYLDDVESAEGTVLYDEFYWPRQPEQTPGEGILAVWVVKSSPQIHKWGLVNEFFPNKVFEERY